MATALLILVVALVSVLVTLLVTGSANYTIRDVIDDGTGMTRLMLEIN